MGSRIEQALESWYAAGLRRIGQVLIEDAAVGFTLRHRDDRARDDLVIYREAEDAAKIAKYDDAENYRPLKTAPNLRHGWRLELSDVGALRRALDFFYPGRLAMFFAFERNELRTTTLRATLARQSGMYRIAAKLSDRQADDLVGRFCRSKEGHPGCLRTILWKRDGAGALSSTQLPREKFDPSHDQAGLGEPVIPLLCQEACNLLIAEARRAVKSEDEATATIQS
jgi:sirohydrochlorin cobaltochelatase